MASWLILSVLLIGLLSTSQAQDLERLRSRLEQLSIHQQAREEFPEELVERAGEALDQLTTLWTNPNSAKTLLLNGRKAADIPWRCLEAAENLLRYTDSMGLPVAVDAVDSFGKIGSGILQGNLYMLGSYDECLDIPNNLTQYCLVSTALELPVKVSVPLIFTIGMCVPQECSNEDIITLVDYLHYLKVVNTTTILIPTNPVNCQPYKDPPYHWTAILMIIICCIIGCLVIASTLADLAIQLWRDGTIQQYLLLSSNQETLGTVNDETPLLLNRPSTKPRKFDPVEWIQVFSLYKNVGMVLSTKVTPAAITSLNGIRVISIAWVILCHTYLWVFTYNGYDNLTVVMKVLGTFSFQAVVNGFFSVDSFFFLSGLLGAYLTLRQMKRRKGKFPYVMFYVHRYLRLTPVYAFVLFFTFFLIMHFGNGPHFSGNWVGGFQWERCVQYWWTNLLYINNLYPWKLIDECVGWTWYLANDMQFFVISPIIIIPMYFLLPLGLTIAAILLFLSFIITAVLSGVFDFQANTFAPFAYQYTTNVTVASGDILYTKPWHRIQPYLVGLVMGYILYKQVKVPFNRYIRLTCYLVMWCLAIIFGMSTVYGLYGTWHGHVPSPAENILYNTFSRFTWSMALALLVYVCHNGYGGWVNSFLSMKLWLPLSRLAFNAYLIHPVILSIVFGTAKKTTHYGDIEMVVYVVAVWAISFTTAFLLTVLVEFPFGNLEIAFFKLFGVGARESTRTDTEAKGPSSPINSKVFVGSYSTNENSESYKGH